MFLLIVIFFQFIKIKDLQSQRTILRGIFISWSSLFIVLIILNSNLIHFIILSGIAALINLISLFSLVDLIIEGLSLARTQKEEFASILSSNDGDINALFETLKKFSKD